MIERRELLMAGAGFVWAVADVASVSASKAPDRR